MVKIEDILKLVGESLPKYVYNSQEFIPGKTPVYYSGPYWDANELVAGINSFLNGKWLVAGENVHKFEAAFSKRFNVKYSHMVNSGSSANLILITSLKKRFGWQDNDEVIVSPVGFPTTISVLCQNNLKPVFVDIEWNTLNFDVDKIEEKITSKTKAIFVSPVLGNPPDFDKLQEICKKYDLLLVGDNCDSLGSKWRGKYLSEYYVAYSNSFYPAHHITTGEGGMVCTNDEELKKLFMSFSWWGRSCFTEAAPIYTKTGVKKIKDIVVGDQVISHTGQYRRVYELTNRSYTGNMFKIKSKGLPEIECTEEHPFYILRGDKYIWEESKNLKEGDFLLRKVPFTDDSDFNTYTTHITPGGLTRKFEYKIDGDLLRLMGYYLAEGSLAKGMTTKGKANKDYKYPRYRVDFSFHENETEYIEDVSKLMRKYFNTACYKQKKKNSKGIVLKFNGHKAYEFFKKHCGEKSFSKMLPWYFIHMKNELLIQLLKGFWRGDGSANFQSYVISTASQTLMEQFKFILNKLGIFTTLSVRTHDKHSSSIVNGIEIKQKHDLYNLVIYKPNALKLENILSESYLDPVISTNHHNYKYFTDDQEYSCHLITEINKNEVEDVMVYNFEVEEDHSYHAYGIISHNCYCVGSANLLSCGTCGNRFDKWLDNYDGIVDHKYIFDNMGYNLKPLDLQGAIGVQQLNKLDDMEYMRMINKSVISMNINHYIKNVKTIDSLPYAKPCWFGTPIVCKTKEVKDRLVAHLEENKIQTRNYFAGNILLHPGYSHLDDYRNYPEANKVLDKVFFIGCSPHYTSSVLEYIDEVFKKFDQ